MKRFVLAVVFVIVISACSPAWSGVYFGWKSYDNLCPRLDAKSKDAMTLGLDYRFGLLRFVKLAVGFDYSWGDVDADCVGCGAASFKHYAVRAGVDVPFWRPSITELYIGGGLSYNWISDPTELNCEVDDQRSGVYGQAGIKISPPVLPVWFLLEGRYEALTGDPSVDISSIMLGVGLGF